MAKNIRWQIPFVSLQGIHYRVDIYDEGTFTPVQLTAGPTPFVTDEDNSEDFFAPVRSQSGTLQVCTKLPSGGMITLNDLLPENNIARPVRLVSIAANNTETIEWQGFLSCEAYSQDYVGIPQILDIPVISVLEAMDSVEVSKTRSVGMATVRHALKLAMDEMMLQSGMSFYTHVNYSDISGNILYKMIDQTIFFEQKEYNNENSTTYIVSGLSVKGVLERVAKYMGWVVREQGTKIYFERIGADNYTLEAPYLFFDITILPSRVDFTTKSLATDVVWMGTGHKRSIAAGAKSVEVAAKLEKYDLRLDIPPCPTGDLALVYGRLYTYSGNGDELYVLANQIENAYSNITVAYYSAMFRFSFNHFEQYANSSISDVLDHMSVGHNSTARQEIIYGGATSMYRWYAGAFLSRYCFEPAGGTEYHPVEDALYCIFFSHSLDYYNNPSVPTDFDPSNVGAIFSINSVVSYRCNSGYIKLNANVATIFQWPSSEYEGAELTNAEKNYEWFIAMELSIGSKWWNGSSWQGTQCTFKARFLKNNFRKNWVNTMPIAETDGLLIPVSEELFGVVTMKIWPMASPTNFSETNTAVLEMIFNSLEVSHILPDDTTLSDRSENHYFRLLGTNFRDEINISTELASMLNNLPSPSLIMDDATTPMKELNYGTEQSPDMRRPEVDLLNRLATYYGEVRQRLDLEVAHLTAAPLPLLKLNGINDGKVYLPLSESRDWKTDVCNLTCFEMPEEPSES